jgi:hypothetical protein
MPSASAGRRCTGLNTRACGVTCLILLAGPAALAGPADKVYLPIVEQGETELELRGGSAQLDAGGHLRALVFDIGYGVTSRWFTELAVEYEDGPFGSGEFEALEWENVFQLTEQGQYWIDVGLFAKYEHKLESGAVDAIVIGPMFQKDAGRAQLNLNLLLERQVGAGADSKLELAYTTQAKWRDRPELEFGLQAFGAADSHSLGPALFSNRRLASGNKLKFDAALLFGVSDNAADVTLRFQIEYEMY